MTQEMVGRIDNYTIYNPSLGCRHMSLLEIYTFVTVSSVLDSTVLTCRYWLYMIASISSIGQFRE